MLDKGRFPRVAAYLNASRDHFLVITDFLLYECMRGNSARNFSTDFSRLVPYVEQLVVLETADVIARFEPRREGLPGRLISLEDTELIRRHLRSSLHGLDSKGPSQSFLDFSAKCRLFRDGLLGKSNDMRACLDEIIQALPKNEISKIRRDEPSSELFQWQLFNQIGRFAAGLYQDNIPLPTEPSGIYALQFRYAAAYVFLAIDWRLCGLEVSRSETDTIHNDAIDLTYITYATFFDGLLCDDQRALRVFQRTMAFIENLLVRFRMI